MGENVHYRLIPGRIDGITQFVDKVLENNETEQVESPQGVK